MLTARVTGGVGRSGLATDSGETYSRPRLVAHLGEDRGAREVSDVVGDLEVSVSTRTLRMHNTLCIARRSVDPCAILHVDTYQGYAHGRSERAGRYGGSLCGIG